MVGWITETSTKGTLARAGGADEYERFALFAYFTGEVLLSYRLRPMPESSVGSSGKSQGTPPSSHAYGTSHGSTARLEHVWVRILRGNIQYQQSVTSLVHGGSRLRKG